MLLKNHWAIVAALFGLCAAHDASATLTDFDFTISYSTSTISGRLVGLNLDANGNGTDVDPASILLFSVPTSAGLAASASAPYLFVPLTYERSTLFSGTLISTTPGDYGFQISNFSIAPPLQNLLMIDEANDVSLVFNFGASLGGEGGTATYGIQAQADSLFPAIDTRVSFSPVSSVPLPGSALLLLTAMGAALGRRRIVLFHVSSRRDLIEGPQYARKAQSEVIALT